MRIALWGYGKMGKTIHAQIEKMAQHTVCGMIGSNTSASEKAAILAKAEGIIEFTRPEAACSNVLEALAAGIPIVSGTTAWNHDLPKIESAVSTHSGKFMIGSNFSIGVNIMFAATELISRKLQQFGGYFLEMEEIHHLQKLDSPSGTAVSLANIVLNAMPQYASWVELQSAESNTNASALPIYVKREPEVPGTHILSFKSEVDTLQISHEAHNRNGFAIGSISALEWLVQQKSGCYNVREMFSI